LAVRVAVDALGGDRAPEEVVAGALEAAGPDIVPILHGPEGLDTGGLELVVAPERIEMDEKPADAVRAKPQSSLVATCRTVGEEDEKGNQLTLEAHALLAASDLRFGGNVESRELLAGAADVVVTDGFTGNVCLKLLEGTIKTLLDALREEITATPRGKLGGLL